MFKNAEYKRYWISIFCVVILLIILNAIFDFKGWFKYVCVVVLLSNIVSTMIKLNHKYDSANK